jgi:hypothetical protein
LTIQDVARLFNMFGGIDILARLRLCDTAEEKREAFEAARAEAKIHHRRLALEHHPDRGGDAEQLKTINAAWTQLQKIKIRPVKRPARKSALNVSEARGPAHTSVFVGVTVDTGGAATTGSAVEWDPGRSLSMDEFQRMIDVLYRGF